MVDRIADGVVVGMAYMMVVEGETIEDAPADDPMFYVHGAGALMPELESALTGKTVGDKFSLEVVMEPEQWEAPIADFDLPEGVKVGDFIEIEDEEGEVMEAQIKALTDDTIVLVMDDMDDWMVGKTAVFSVEVVSLREATEEEKMIGEPEEYFDMLEDHDHDHDEDEYDDDDQ